MNAMMPSPITDLKMVISNAKRCVERGEPDAIADMCRPLLPYAGRADVDRVLGALLKLLLRHASARSIAAIEAEAFPLDHLRTGWNHEGSAVAYLGWKYRQTFRPQGDPDLAQARVLVAAGQALWPHLDEETRLLQGLYVKLAVAHGALADVPRLRELSDNLVGGSLNDERQQKALIRTIRELQWLQAFNEIASLLELLLARPEHNPAWGEIILTMLTALRASAKQLSEYQYLVFILEKAMPWLVHIGADVCDKRIASAMIHCADFDGLHALLPQLLTKMQDVTARATLLTVLEHLQGHDVLGNAVYSLEQIYREDPSNPTAALLLARYLHECNSPSTAIEPLFEAMRLEDTRYDEAVSKAAWLCYSGKGMYEQVIRWFDAHPLNDWSKARSLLNRAQAATERPSLPHCVSEADGERMNLEAMGPLAPSLAPLVHATNGDFSYTAQPSRDELRATLRGVEDAVTQVTEVDGNLSPSICLSIVCELVRAATVHMHETIAERHGAPIAFGPQYGLLDTTRMTDIYETLHRVALRLSQHGIEAMLHNAPLANIRDLCQLARLHVQSAFALGQPETSEVILQALHARRIAPALILRLLERCALQRGDLRTAEQFVAGQVTEAGQIFAIEPFEIWSRTVTLACDVLVDEKPWRGTFEYVDSQGTLHQAPHEVPATRVDLFRVPGLRIFDTEILISQRGTIPHPHPWHLRHIYDYPRRSSIYINHGKGGCRLRPASERLQVREPVVVLFNMDATFLRNYYHWMLLILTRVAVLLDHGLLEHRRLLLPVELSEWMKVSLELVGLREDQILYYTAEQEVLVDDALVVSSVEFAAASLIKPLQRRLWAAAGVTPAASRSRPPVWLSRRRQHLRHLANTDAVEALAQKLGFQVVVPESLSLKDQVRLCAEAKAIAGPDGANLTNLIFASPGTPVLSLVNENNNYPTFVDICVVMDLPQRWLFGRADPRKAWWGLPHEPYEIELTVLEHELRRLVAAR